MKIKNTINIIVELSFNKRTVEPVLHYPKLPSTPKYQVEVKSKVNPNN